MSTENENPTHANEAASEAQASASESSGATPREVLSTNTSLDELFSAILGADAFDGDERGPLVETVEAQVREIREELGLVEPRPPEPPPSAKPLPEFVPVFRTRPPDDLTYSDAQGAQWSVARTHRWSGLFDVSVVERVPRSVLVAVPAAAVLFAAGIYWGTTTGSAGSAMPTPAASMLHAAPSIDTVVARIDTASPPDVATPTSFVTPEAPAAAVAPPAVAPAPRPSATPATTGSAPPPASASVTSTPATRPPSRPLAPTPPANPPAQPTRTLASQTQTELRPAETSVPAPVGTSGTTTSPSTTSNLGTTPTGNAGSSAEPAPPTPVVDAPLVLPPNEPVESPTTPTATGASSPPATVAPPPPAAASEPMGTPRLTREAVLVSRVPPVYPELARRLGTTGDVELDVEIDANGRVVRASSVSGPRALRDAAESAVLQWRYQPQITDGAAVASRRRVRVSFK